MLNNNYINHRLGTHILCIKVKTDNKKNFITRPIHNSGF